MIWDISNRMEFPRLFYILSLDHFKTESHWNLIKPKIIKVMQFPKSKQKLMVQSASGKVYIFELDKFTNECVLSGIIEEKKW